jgi:hypothetical protein
MYENGKIRPFETIPGMGQGGYRRMMEGVNLIMPYCKNFGKCHNVPGVKQEREKISRCLSFRFSLFFQ